MIGRRQVFIPHYKGDTNSVKNFINSFSDVLTPEVLGVKDTDEFINSTNTDYVMSCIRRRYLDASTVTIVLIGTCTHSRRYVDWEIKSSLRQGSSLPNGLIGILLPGMESAHLPPRLKDNWGSNADCYARYYKYPRSSRELAEWIDDAYNARTSRAKLINNSNEMMKYNSKCRICGVTH